MSALAERRRRRQRRLPLRRRAASRTRPSTPRTTGSTRASSGPSRPTRAGRRSPRPRPAAGAIDVDRATHGDRAPSTSRSLPASVTGTTFTLRDADGGAVPADRDLRRADPHGAGSCPQAPLAYGTHVHARRSRAAPAACTDAAGNPLAADKTWTFTIAGAVAGRGPGRPDPRRHGRRATSSRSYYAEILRGEGLNEFSVADGPVTAPGAGRQADRDPRRGAR